MHLMYRALKYALTASIAAAGMASAQTPPAPAPDATNQPAAPAGTTEAPAPAEAAPKKSATEEITVTGTRVRRKDLNTPAPVTVLSRDQITASGKVSLGEFLQALPEQGNTVNAQVNNGNDGSIYVSLRSLGSARTLVLVNGRRMVPGGTGANSAADLATIPAAAVERIEVLKDGASAIYGSDAISGVVNVILRKRYNGTEVGGYAGTSQKGDGQTYDVHAVTGTAGEKGSMLFSVGYQEQRPVFAGDREFSGSTFNWDFDQGCYPDSNTGACGSKLASGSGNSGTWPNSRFTIPASACANNAAFMTAHPALASVCAQSANKGGGFIQDKDAPAAEKYIPYDGVPYNTNPTNYLITPSRRVQLFSTGDVNLGSEARAFFEASYVNRTSSQSLAPMPLVSSTIPLLPVTISKDSVFNPFGVDIATWRKRTVEFAERLYKQDLDTFRVVAGFDGSLGEWAGPLAGWSWGADFNHGRTAGSTIESGQLRMPNIANAAGPSAISPTTGKPVCLRVKTGVAATDFAKSNIIAGCVPIDLLHGVSPDTMVPAKNYVSYTGTDFGTNQQDIFSVNFSGELFKLAAERPAGLAIGGDYRRESASFQNNPINSGESSGNNQLSTIGGYNVKEVYGELVIPLLSGMPGVEDLELQAAARYNDFSTFGSNTTYKLGVRWSPLRDITARATYGTAFRAPNVGELYGGAQDDYPAVRDPCGGKTATSDPVISARCKTGPGSVVGGPAPGFSADTSTQFLSKHIANAQLGPEEATTFTAGVVLQPQMVRNLSITIDYYNLNVTKTIAQLGAGFILDQCYRSDVQDKAACDLIIRNDAGQIIVINDERANLGNYHTTGVDFAVRYGMPTEEFGRFNLIVDGTWLNSFQFTDVNGVRTNGAGNYDLGALPKLKLNAGVFWAMGPINAGVSGRYVGNFKECAVGVCSDEAGGDSSQARQIGHYLPIDLFVGYTLKNWTAGTTNLTVGVTNLTDVQPPYIATAFAANSDPSTYDYVGRFFYTRLTHTF